MSATDPRRNGFTLVEVLVAVAILATAFTIIWTTFSVSLDGWRRGQLALDRVNHGDFVMEQTVSALRSAAFFSSRPEKYGFWLKDNGRDDELSWVTSGSAFMKPDDPLARGFHRLWIGIKENPDGDASFAVRAYPHFAEDMEPDDVEPWFISSRVKGLDCKIWNNDEEDWEDEWENSNAVPSLIQLTFYMEPAERHGPETTVTRLVEIPIGPGTLGAVARAPGEGAPAGTNAQSGVAAGETGESEETAGQHGIQTMERAP